MDIILNIVCKSPKMLNEQPIIAIKKFTILLTHNDLVMNTPVNPAPYDMIALIE
jgi:hypothetical protein